MNIKHVNAKEKSLFIFYNLTSFLNVNGTEASLLKTLLLSDSIQFRTTGAACECSARTVSTPSLWVWSFSVTIKTLLNTILKVPESIFVRSGFTWNVISVGQEKTALETMEHTPCKSGEGKPIRFTAFMRCLFDLKSNQVMFYNLFTFSHSVSIVWSCTVCYIMDGFVCVYLQLKMNGSLCGKQSCMF